MSESAESDMQSPSNFDGIDIADSSSEVHSNNTEARSEENRTPTGISFLSVLNVTLIVACQTKVFTYPRDGLILVLQSTS